MKTIVSDNGTGFVKAGYAGDMFPAHTIPAMVGRPILRADESADGDILKDIMVGDLAHKHRNLLDCTYPLSKGIVSNWEDMRILWEYTWEKLGVKPGEESARVMLTEAPMNPRKNRMRAFECMFEEYKFDAAFIEIQAVLVLHSQGIFTGTVVDSGDGVTHVIPVVDGHHAPQRDTAPNTLRLDLAGHKLTEHMLTLLQRRGYSFNNQADFATVQQIKERFAYAAVDFDLEKRLAYETTVLEKTMTLPDGRSIKVGMERFECAEPLFRPDLMDIETPTGGIAQMTFESINRSARDCQADLFKHVILSGGTTMLPGLPSRMLKDMKELYIKEKFRGDASKGKVKIKIEETPRKKHAVFVGAASLAEFMEDSQWVSKQEWEEIGEEAVMQKCSPGH